MSYDYDYDPRNRGRQQHYQRQKNAVSVKVLIAVGLVAAVVLFGVQRTFFNPNTLNTSGTAAGSEPVPTHSTHSPPVSLEAITSKSIASAGPVTDLDRELLTRVRLANLWELQAGAIAQERGTDERVKRAGMHLLEGHSRLDQIARELSVALDVEIPDEPNEAQQGWLDEMERLEGEEFNIFFANILREAHGLIFPVVATVRSTTQNFMIRDLAIETIKAVSDHLEVLEDTGRVTPETLDKVAEGLEVG